MHLSVQIDVATTPRVAILGRGMVWFTGRRAANFLQTFQWLRFVPM